MLSIYSWRVWQWTGPSNEMSKKRVKIQFLHKIRVRILRPYAQYREISKGFYSDAPLSNIGLALLE